MNYGLAPVRERHFAASQLLLSAPFRSRFASQPHGRDPSLSIQVPDCLGAYHLLRARGVEFLTRPFEVREKI